MVDMSNSGLSRDRIFSIFLFCVAYLQLDNISIRYFQHSTYTRFLMFSYHQSFCRVRYQINHYKELEPELREVLM
jgi:hypothetical protein